MAVIRFPISDILAQAAQQDDTFCVVKDTVWDFWEVIFDTDKVSQRADWHVDADIEALRIRDIDGVIVATVWHIIEGVDVRDVYILNKDGEWRTV